MPFSYAFCIKDVVVVSRKRLPEGICAFVTQSDVPVYEPCGEEKTTLSVHNVFEVDHTYNVTGRYVPDLVNAINSMDEVSWRQRAWTLLVSTRIRSLRLDVHVV